MINKLNLSEETITILDNFNGLLGGIERDYAAIRSALSDVNAEQQDLLHEFELSPLAADERSLVANKMIEVRKRRRQLLDDMEIIEPFIMFKKGHETLGIPMAKLCRDMVKIREKQGNRQYTPRVRKDIKLFHGELAKGGIEE